jgi:hypothetical protein
VKADHALDPISKNFEEHMGRQNEGEQDVFVFISFKVLKETQSVPACALIDKGCGPNYI